MTEAEWMKSNDPARMYACVRRLSNTRQKKTKRKFRLYACSSCLPIWRLLTEDGRQAVTTSEEYADGRATSEQLSGAENRARSRRGSLADFYASFSASAAITEHARMVALNVRRIAEGSGEFPSDGAMKILGKQQSNALRCIFGNPFRPITLAPSCLTPTVTQLAEAIYQEGAFDRLPVLADALEESGCTQPDVLAHLRSGGEHVRGCWALDLVTGRQ